MKRKLRRSGRIMETFTYTHRYLFSVGHYEKTQHGIRLFSDQESDYYEEMEKNWRNNYPNMNLYEAQMHYLPRMMEIRKERGDIDIQEVKSRHSIVDLVESSGVKLRKLGAKYSGNCPYHNDTNSSLYLYPDQNRWWCFGENIGGDVFDWIQKMHNMSFREALHHLNDL